jgi:hypothetical protein
LQELESVMIDDLDLISYSHSVISSEEYNDHMIGIKSKNLDLRHQFNSGSIKTSNIGDDSMNTRYGDTTP